MLGDRNLPPMTNLFVFDQDGNKRQLHPADLGAQHEEQLGRRVRGLGAPPPTSMIVVPQHLLSEDEVIASAQLEKRAFSWQLHVALDAVRLISRRVARHAQRGWDQVMAQLGRCAVMLQERVQRLKEQEAPLSWSEDETVVVDRRRRPESVF